MFTVDDWVSGVTSTFGTSPLAVYPGTVGTSTLSKVCLPFSDQSS